MDLTLDNHGIDDGAEIIDRGPRHDLAFSRLRIDFDLADVTAGREREVGRVIEGALLETRFQLTADKFMRNIGVECDVAPGDGFVGAADGELSIPEHNIAFGSFQHMGGDLLRLGLDLVERLDDRRNTDRPRPRAISTHAELHLVGVAMHDADIVDRYAEP